MAMRMAARKNAATTIAPPEPDLTPGEMLRRAVAMRSVLRERQDRTEAHGAILTETNDDFIKAGFYRIVQPRRFGGYEFDMVTFVKVMVEIARGCPSSGWVLSLTAGHPLILALFDDEAQFDAYGADGEFRCPAVGTPAAMTQGRGRMALPRRLGLCLGLRHGDASPRRRDAHGRGRPTDSHACSVEARGIFHPRQLADDRHAGHRLEARRRRRRFRCRRIASSTGRSGRRRRNAT